MPAGIEVANVVDVVTNTGREVALIVVAVHPWTDEQVLALQSKVKLYLAYLESGQMLRDYPAAKGLPVRFQLDTTHPLSPLANRFVAVATDTWLRPIGVRFSVVELPDDV
jgi:hypothetical protein